MSSSSIQGPSILPPELEEIIFILAALADCLDALNIARVAHRTHIWIEPIIYSKVVLDFPKSNVDSFMHVIRTKDASFFARHVKILHLTRAVSTYRAKRILKLCSNATDIICWAPLSPQTFSSIAPLEKIERLSVFRNTLYQPLLDPDKPPTPSPISPTRFKTLKQLYVIANLNTDDNINISFRANSWAFHCPVILNFAIGKLSKPLEWTRVPLPRELMWSWFGEPTWPWVRREGSDIVKCLMVYHCRLRLNRKAEWQTRRQAWPYFGRIQYAYVSPGKPGAGIEDFWDLFMRIVPGCIL